MECSGEEKCFCPLPKIEPQFSGHSAHSSHYTDLATWLLVVVVVVVVVAAAAAAVVIVVVVAAAGAVVVVAAAAINSKIDKR
jgi:hypothetical protein